MPAGGGVALRMRGVRKTYGAVRALDGVDLEVRRGEVLALVGENGAGKSTLMKVLAGAVAPDAGALELEGEPYAPHGPLDALRRGVAMIYQELNLAPHLSVEENVLLGREATRFGVLSRRASRGVVRDALARLGHEEVAPTQTVGELGPGRRQVVELARALASDARVLVLDEPTSSLSRPDVERLFDVVARLRAEGVALVYISHFLDEVRRVADRYVVLRDGRTAGAGPVTEDCADEIVRLMVGRPLEEAYPKVPHEPGEVVLELDALAGAPLPARASLALRRGEILGVAGLVGAGRTELLRAVFGLAPVRAGEVRVAGLPAGPGSPRARLAQGVGLLSEDRKEEGLALGMSVADNSTLSDLRPFTRFGRLSRRAQAAGAARWIEELGVRCDGPEQAARELSGGNQQKVALARLLHRDVDVLLLDEPTRGVDVGSKVELYRRMGELAARGKALLVVSSYLPELLGVCDRIAVMHRGVLGDARPARAWTRATLLDAATQGAA